MDYFQLPKFPLHSKPHDAASKVPAPSNPRLSHSSSMKQPPKKAQLFKSSSVHADITTLIQERDYDTIDYELSFNSLVEHNATNLPMQVDASDSLYGVVGGESLSQGEVLNLHFLKETSVVIGSSKFGSDQHKIMVPVCSSYRFNVGLCTDAQTSLSNIMKLLRSSPLPKVVCVDKEAWPVKAGELLLVKGIIDNDTINCWSITERKRKHLSKSCQASFNVTPECTQVYLSDIIDHCRLPLTVLLYDSAGISPLTLTINERSIMTTVIATKQSKPEELIEVKVSSCNLMVRRLEASEYSQEKLQESTACIYKAFHPTQVRRIMDNVHVCYSTYETKLFTSVLDNWTSSIQLVKPSLPPALMPTSPKRDQPPTLDLLSDIHQPDRKSATFSDELTVHGYAQPTPFLINLNSCYYINLQSDTARNQYMNFDHIIPSPTISDRDCIFVSKERNSKSTNLQQCSPDHDHLIYESPDREAFTMIKNATESKFHNINITLN